MSLLIRIVKIDETFDICFYDNNTILISKSAGPYKGLESVESFPWFDIERFPNDKQGDEMIIQKVKTLLTFS